MALDPGDGMEAYDTAGLGETVELEEDNAADLAEEIEIQMAEGKILMQHNLYYISHRNFTEKS